jgi:cytochrome P450
MSDMTAAGPDGLLAEALLDPEGRADPYPLYAALREQAPAVRTAQGPVVVARYDDCEWVLRDPRFGKGTPRPWERHGLTEADWHERFPGWARNRRALLFLDPPDHTRVRRLVAKAFTPRTVERLRPDIVRLTDAILDRFDGVVDAISDLALALPITVIGEMLGVPEADRHELQPLVRASIVALDTQAALDELDVALRARDAVVERMEGLIAERRAHPADDLLSHLIHVEEAGDKLTPDELGSTITQLFAAGFETTTNLIGNGLLALLDHPDQMARLRADRSLVGPAVEEMVRWDSAVQLDSRQPLVDVDVHGIPVRRGEQVITLLGAANRDPRTFPDPDRFDVGRDGAAPLSFGSGIHYCLGAALARAEGQVVFDRLLTRFPVLEPAWPDGTRPTVGPSPVLRGRMSLPVRVDRQPGHRR